MKDKFFRYVIEKNNVSKEYYIEFINDNDIAVPLTKEDYSWAKANSINCSACLNEDVNEYCNLALNISYFIDFFSEFNSFDNVIVTVQTDSYTLTKATTIQQTALSILNLIIPFSGCPLFIPMKEIAKNHIPFESVENILIRLIGNQAFQIYRKDKNLKNFNITDCITKLESMREPIKNISNVVRNITPNDAVINSLILLDTYIFIMSDILEGGE